MKTISINGRMIGEGCPCYIIAELSANHNQDIDKAKRLIEIAKECGADAVKTQTYTPETITLDCDNQYFRITDGPWKGQTLFELYQKAYTPFDWQKKLKAHADRIGISFFSTPFDFTAVDLLEKIDVQAYKIASFEIVDIPLLETVARKNKPIIVSCGMSTLSEIELAVQTIRAAGNNDIVLLKCTSDYPAKPAEMNLNAIKTLSKCFDVPVGFSDHSMYNEIAIMAVGLGACIIEKHITERRSDGGPDSEFSLEPGDLRSLVNGIRISEVARGMTAISPTQGEMQNFKFRKSLFVCNSMKAGEIFTTDNIRSIRPGFGLPPKYLARVLGKRSRCSIAKGTPLKPDMIDKFEI
jgi:pseudaminic acid synthase